MRRSRAGCAREASPLSIRDRGRRTSAGPRPRAPGCMVGAMNPPADEPREPNEERLIDGIVRVMRAKLERDYAPDAPRRDAHPKHTGLLKAELTIERDLPPALRVGLFAEPRTYEAWVRT